MKKVTSVIDDGQEIGKAPVCVKESAKGRRGKEKNSCKMPMK